MSRATRTKEDYYWKLDTGGRYPDIWIRGFSREFVPTDEPPHALEEAFRIFTGARSGTNGCCQTW